MNLSTDVTGNILSPVSLSDNADGYVIADAIRLVGETEATSTVTGNTFYVHSDHLGTPKKLTDATQTVVWDAVYQPFGQVSLPTELITYNQRFPGQYYDQETGLHYNYFRDYEPSTGRYVESDPIGLAGGVNTYVYVDSNPIKWIDSKGLRRFFPWGPVDKSAAEAGVGMAEGAREGLSGNAAAVDCRGNFCKLKKIPTRDDIIAFCIEKAGSDFGPCLSGCVSLTIYDDSYSKECLDRGACL